MKEVCHLQSSACNAESGFSGSPTMLNGVPHSKSFFQCIPLGANIIGHALVEADIYCSSINEK